MDCMIDLETLGTKPGCPVISIGAVFFDYDKAIVFNNPENMFYRCMDVQDQLNNGFRIDADTIKWWMGQSGAAKHVFKETAKPPREVLQSFADFIKKYPKTIVWGNGSHFDISILETLFIVYGIPIPWTYSNVNDVRTFKRCVAGGAKIPPPEVAHNALSDALGQANYIVIHLRNHSAVPKQSHSEVPNIKIEEV